MKKPTESEIIDMMISWIDTRFDETHSEIILKGEKRQYIIVPHKLKHDEN